MLRALCHQAKNDALAQPAIRDPQPPDRPGPADRLQDRTARDDKISAFGTDARLRRTPSEIQAGQRMAQTHDIREIQPGPIHDAPVVSRKIQLQPG